jgi:hypothetical protein
MLWANTKTSWQKNRKVKRKAFPKNKIFHLLDRDCQIPIVRFGNPARAVGRIIFLEVPTTRFSEVEWVASPSALPPQKYMNQLAAGSTKSPFYEVSL